MATLHGVSPTNRAADRQGGRGKQGRTAGRVATTALGLALLIGGMVAQSWPAGASGAHVGTPHGVGERPVDASITADYRWDFERYPAR